MGYKGVIFDFDGTLFDTGEGIMNCITKALKDMGKPALAAEDLRYFIGPSLIESFDVKCGITGDEAWEAVRIFREYYQHQGGVYQSYPYEGIAGLLQEIKARGIRLAVASSKPQTMVELLLEKYDLLALFDYINGAGGAEETSDKADKVKDCVESLGLSPAECVMAGDRKFDVEAAKAVGIASIYALYGYGSREEMEACEPSFCAETVADFKKIILGH